MSTFQNWNIKSTPATHYTGEIVQGAYENENFPAFSGDGAGFVVHAAIKSSQKLAWALEILDIDGNILETIEWVETDARQCTIDGDTWYFYDKQVELGIPMLKFVAVPVNLRNYSSTPKAAYDDTSATTINNTSVTVYFVLKKS